MVGRSRLLEMWDPGLEIGRTWVGCRRKGKPGWRWDEPESDMGGTRVGYGRNPGWMWDERGLDVGRKASRIRDGTSSGWMWDEPGLDVGRTWVGCETKGKPGEAQRIMVPGGVEGTVVTSRRLERGREVVLQKISWECGREVFAECRCGRD